MTLRNKFSLLTLLALASLTASIYAKDLGYTNTNPTINTIDPVLARTWTSKLKGHLLLSQINIPGTHDSGTSKSPFWSQFSARCQSLTIKAQLDAGIRFLDFRIRYEGGFQDKYEREDLVVFHGPIEVNLLFSQVLKDVQYFFKESSQQFIIMSFAGMEQRDSKNVIRDPSDDVLASLRLALGPMNVIVSKNIPTVAQARGKVWIIGGSWLSFGDKSFMLYYDPRQGNYDPPDGGPNKYYISGLYEISKDFTVEQKSQKVYEAAFKVITEPDRLKINGLGAVGAFLNLQLTPIKIAQDKIGPNARLCSELKNPLYDKVNIGLSIGDFLGPQLIDRIIRSNGVS